MRRPTLATAAALAALLLVPAVAPAQRQQPPAQQQVEIPGDGTDLFRAILDLRGIKPVRQQDVWNLGPSSDVIVIVLGSPNDALNIDPTFHAQQVLAKGGATLVAADTHLDLSGFNRWNVTTIDGGRIRCRDRDSILAVRTEGGGLEWQPECPLVVPLSPRTHPPGPPAGTAAASVFNGLDRVATNSPSCIHVGVFGGFANYALAGFPPDCDIVRGNEFRRFTAKLPQGALFAAGGEGTDQVGNNWRFLAMADHSVFINQMLMTPGTQNWELAFRVVDFLSAPTFQGEGPQRKRVNTRTRCLFIENGRVVERFDGLRQAFAPPRPPIPLPDPKNLQQKLTDFGNSFVDWLETSDTLNHLVVRGFGLPSIMKFFLILLTIYATWFLLRRMFTYRKPTDLPPAPAVAGVPSGPPGVFDRRQKELIRRNNLYEPVRDLTREFFASIGIHGEPGPKPPKIVISDMVRKPESLRLAVKDFWKLAYGEPQEVSASRWREMEPYFERLRQAHANGKWRFVMPDEPVGVE